MSPSRAPANVAASVRARLLELSRRRGVEFQRVLSDYAIERLLYRLAGSPHAGRFVLKGAMVFKLWSDDRHRATWDLDLLGRGASAVSDVTAVIRELCGIDAADGIVFDPDSATGEEIRPEDEYEGVRVRLQAHLAGARIPLQVDVAFGDAVVPRPQWRDYPTLLDHAPPRILAYPPEAVVAEKLEAAVSLGVTNSRMKDFYDLHVLASSLRFEGPTLAQAIRATFERRDTPLPEGVPLVPDAGVLGRAGASDRVARVSQTGSAGGSARCRDPESHTSHVPRPGSAGRGEGRGAHEALAAWRSLGVGRECWGMMILERDAGASGPHPTAERHERRYSETRRGHRGAWNDCGR